MSFFGNNTTEQFKKKITSLSKVILGSDTTKTSETENVFKNKKDKFSRSKSEELTYGQITQKVWVDGKEFVIVANSQQDLKSRIEKINAKNKASEENMINTDVFAFASLYTEQQEVKANEWVEKRDVWVYEYIPA